jgi:hypothetical protein
MIFRKTTLQWVNGKTVPVLIKHRAMKTYGGVVVYLNELVTVDNVKW